MAFNVGCGKKGPPLAPLVKLPVPPADLAAARRGDTVDLTFSVPSANTDGTRPANVSRADVYAITVPVTTPPLSDASLLKFGTKVGSVTVKAPRDPNLTADVDDPSDEVDAPEGPGLDQGAVARMAESLTPDTLEPVDVPRDKNTPAATPIETSTDGPLLGPPPTAPLRTYAAFGVSARGKKGPLSARVTVPLVPPPPSPTAPTITYDETAITVTWEAVDLAPAAAKPTPPAADPRLLPSRVIGEGATTDEWMPIGPILTARPTVIMRAAIGYNVYDATVPDEAVKLTKTLLAEPSYTDTRIVWGEERCYVVVAVETVGEATLESEAPPPVCDTLVDTFPPAAPKGINAIATEGAINLIWEPNTEKDLAGYVVLRGVEPAQTLEAITSAPIVEPSFRDAVQPGVVYAYAVRAVDKAGNASPPSTRVVETAR